ncbi:MAG: TIGR04282 family arsenosugar biosynthesis glycosyltransferase [Gammaproteobacteria bacterium]
MKTDGCVLIIFTKAPVPGRVNTRLIPALGEDVAKELYLELLRKTLATAATSGINVRLYCTPDINHPQLVELAKEFGVSLHPQRGRNLGERMDNALHEILRDHKAAVLAGCDIPELSGEDLATACTRLCSDNDAVLGPAEDGGFYLIGLSRECRGLFDNMKWGQGDVLAEMRQRLQRLGMNVYELPEHWDVDRPRDVARYRRRFETRINLAGKY